MLMRYQFFLCTCLFCHLTVVSSCSRSSDVTVGLSVSPAYLARGADEELTFLSDARLDGGTPSLELLPADGLTLSNVQRVDDQTVTCTVMVASDAPLGRRIARLRIGSTSGETELQVVEAIPPDTASDSSPVDSASEPTDTATETDSDTEDMSDAAVSVSPQSIFTNSVQSFILTGTDAHFSESSVITFPQDSGLVVLSSSYESSLTIGESYLHFTLEAHETADTGWVIGTVSSPIGNGVEELFFTLQVVAAPTMVISPTSGYPGTTVPLSIHGFDTHFSADMPSTLLLISPEGQGVEIDLTAIYTTADIAATVYIDEDAAPGSYTVSATTSTTPADEVVEAAFTVLSVDTDTHTDTGDTDTSTDTQDTDTAVCNDFDVVPSQIPVGSFQKSLRLEGSGGINWVSWDRSIVMAGESEQFYLNDPESDPTEKCYVSTPQDITCSITAGLFVTPGAYTITVTSGGVTTCGTLTVTGDDVATMAIPAGLLPQKNTYEGELSTTTNRSDFYSFNAAAGDMVVFHAVSLDRSTMDPILRLIDSTGAQWLYFVDNETSGGGIDARFAHFFAEAGTFHLEVGPQLSSNYGRYVLYIHRLTHGSALAEEEDNNSIATARDIGGGPVLVYGAINDSDDNDYYLVTLTGPSAIDVAGRRITQWTESAADTRLDLYDTDGVALDNCSIWFEIPTTADPRLFVETAGTYAVRVQAEDEGYGFYALNVRPLVVINEVDNRSSSTNPFVELLGPPSFSLAGWALCTFDGNGDPVDAGDPCVDLSALSTDSMGYLAIQDSAVASSALALPPGPGALSLQYLGTPVDGVQYGAVTTGVLAEGEPAEVGTWRVIGRAAGVDTNNNRMDFMYMEAPSQGLPNDRKFPAALPLYGEPEG